MDLNELKDYLKITWNEENSYLSSLMDEGMFFLNEKAGVEIDYSKDLSAKALLKDYCRYAYNHTLELFEVNFQRQLLHLSLKEGVKAYETSNTEADS